MAARKMQDPLIEIEREIGLRGNLHDFLKMAWHVVEPSTPFFDGYHIGAQCEHYQAIEEEQIKWLLVNIPPGCSKSRISGVFWPVWAWLQKPGLRWGHFSFDGDLTLRQGRDSLALIRSPWFQARWPGKIVLAARDPAEGSYYNTDGGWRFANSVEGKALGSHFHRQVIDDPLKSKGLSPVTLAGAKSWLSNTMGTRWARGSEHTARSIVMQRLHEDDTSAQALADGRYVHLMLPMEYEAARKCTVYVTWKEPDVPHGHELGDGNTLEERAEEKLTNKYEDGARIFFEDWRTKEKELLCPEFMTREVVEGLKTDLTPQDVASQLQQNPQAAGGNLFKDYYFRTWTLPDNPTEHLEQELMQLEDGEWIKRPWTFLPKRLDLQWQSWDFAFKDLKTSDYVVGQVWGRYKADFYLLWQVRERMDFNASMEALKAVTKQFPKARMKLIEDKANGTAVMNAAKRIISGIKEVEPDGGKEARASACLPLHVAGNVYYPDVRMKGFEWITQHKAEMCAFPFGKFDDTVDAESQALNEGSAGFRQFNAAMSNLQGQSPQAIRLRQMLSRFGK